MGLFGGNKSTSTTNTSTSVNERTFAFGGSGAPIGVLSDSPGGSITFSDQGAIMEALGFAEGVAAQSADLSRSAIDAVERGTRGDLADTANKLIKYGALALGLYFLSGSFTK